MQSEVRTAAVPTAANTWTAVGTFTVPAGVNRLIRVLVSIAPDTGATVSINIAPVFRLTGSGLLEQNPHEYVGPCGAVVGATSGGGTLQMNNVEYGVDIPVATGGTIDAQCNSLDEFMAAGTARVQLIYDTGAVVQANSMSQYVDAAISAAAGAWTTVGTITVPMLEAGTSPKKIKEIMMAATYDNAAAALERTSSRFRVTGSGIAEGGSHEFLGPASGNVGYAAGVEAYDRAMVRQKIVIPINAGGQILVEQYLDAEFPAGGGTAIFGVMYE